MKIKTIRLAVFILLLFLPIVVFGQKKAIRLNDSLTIDSVQLLMYSGKTIDKVTINDRLKMKIYLNRDTLFENISLYFDDILYKKLNPLPNETNVYAFYIEDIAETGDTISKVFKREKKVKIETDLILKIDKNRPILVKKLEIIYDQHKKKRTIWSVVTILILVLGTALLLGKKSLNFLKDQKSKMANPPYSLARTQLAFWTAIIVIGYFVSWINTGEQIAITTQVLILLGISAGTTLTARLIDNSEVEEDPDQHHNQESEGFFKDILSDNKGLSIHRYQNVIFTAIIGSYFLYKVSASNAFPDIDNNLLVLMGISAATYVTIKQGENKKTKPENNDEITERIKTTKSKTEKNKG